MASHKIYKISAHNIWRIVITSLSFLPLALIPTSIVRVAFLEPTGAHWIFIALNRALPFVYCPILAWYVVTSEKIPWIGDED